MKPGAVFPRWVSHFNTQAEQPSVRIEQSVSGYQLNVHISGMYLDPLLVDGKEYVQVSIPGTDHALQPGLPQLPMITRLIELPSSGDVDIQLTHTDKKLYSLQSLGYHGSIVPAPSEQAVGQKTQALRIKADVYKKDCFYPENPLQISKPVTIRGRRYARLEYYPVRYNPVTGEIQCGSLVEADIVFHHSPSTGKSYRPLVTDKAAVPLTRSMADGRVPVYLVITPASFQSTHPLNLFLEWKRQKGFQVKTALLENIGADTTSVRQYIQNAYREWEEPPMYVLLVGDETLVPTFTGRYVTADGAAKHVTDLYYAALDGDDDVFPDLYLGRFPATNESQLLAMVEKSMAYEQLLAPNRDWLEYATLVATKDPVFHELVEKGNRETLKNYLSPYQIRGDTIRTFENPDKAALRQAVQRGTSFIVYSGHGTDIYWNDLGSAAAPFSLVDVYYLNNTDQYPLVFSFGCSSGDFSQPECLGESWLRYVKTGAALFWGATDLAFWHQDNYLQDRLFNALTMSDNECIAAGTTTALLGLFTRGYPRYEYYHEIMNLLGDPSLPVWLGLPGQLQVTAPDTLHPGSQKVPVNIQPDSSPALAALSSNGVLLASGYTQNGSVTLLPNASLNGDAEVMLTVTRPGVGPYTKSIVLDAGMTLSIDPTSLVAINGDQDLQLVVQQNGSPVKGMEITIDGIHYNKKCTTNDQGIATTIINMPFGQELTMFGKFVHGTDIRVAGVLPVVADQSFDQVAISAGAPAIDEPEQLSAHAPAVFEVSASEAIDQLIIQGCGLDTAIAANMAELVPQSTGRLSVSAAKTGHQLATEWFTVTALSGILDGTVLSTDQAGISGVSIQLAQISSEKKYTASSDDAGNYRFQDVAAGAYQITIAKHGYHSLTDTVMVKSGETVFDATLTEQERVNISGRIVDAGGNAVANAWTMVWGQDMADTSCTDGSFQFENVVPGACHIIANAVGYHLLDTTLVVGQENDFLLYLNSGSDELFFDFEDNEGLLAAQGQWQWGVPGPGLYYRGPEAAWSGDKCWGTVLDGDYGPNADYALTMAPIDLSGLKEPVLEFKHYYVMDHLNTGYDGGNVKISSDNGQSWDLLYPVNNYPAAAIESMFNEPGFSGFIDNWQTAEYDLAEWKDETILLTWQFTSTDRVEDAGWYLDDVKIYDRSTSALDDDPSQPEKFKLYANYPNPFNGSTVIEFTLPGTAWVDLSVYNVLGQRIRDLQHHTLGAGLHRATWDGKDRLGRDCGAGIYWVRLNAASSSDMIKVLLLR